MANPNPTYADVLASAMQKIETPLTDSVSNKIALYAHLKDNDGVKPVDGGPSIVQPVEYASNETYIRYSGGQLLNITPQSVLTALQYPWKQIAISVSATGYDLMVNSGSSQVFDYMESLMKNAEHSFLNNYNSDLISDGSADGGKQIGGLQLLIADDPTTGTVAGIDRATWEFARNQASEKSGVNVTSVTNIYQYYSALWLACAAVNGKTSIIFADDNHYSLYEQAVFSIARIMQDGGKMAKLGFEALKFKTAEVVYQPTITGMPANHSYFVDGRYLKIRPHKKRNMVPLGGARESVNQDAVIKLIGHMGNETASNLRVHGVLFDS